MASWREFSSRSKTILCGESAFWCLFFGGLVLRIVAPSAYDFGIIRPLPILITAGLLVGFGTRLGSGCTSGHGICGISRLSARSLCATGTFITIGALTVYLLNLVIGS